MSDGWTSLHLDTIELLDTGSEGVPLWRPLRHLLGVRAFGVNAWTAREAGDQLVEPHDEATPEGGGHEELYVVLRGAAEFTIGEDTFAVRAGSIVFISDPRLHRSAVATEAGTTVLTVGAEPGGTFEPSEWEGRYLSSAGAKPDPGSGPPR